MKRETIQRVATPTAILVALPEPLATQCADQLADGGLKVLRAGHVAAACERIPIVMPQLVIAPTSLAPVDVETLDDRCVARRRAHEDRGDLRMERSRPAGEGSGEHVARPRPAARRVA